MLHLQSDIFIFYSEDKWTALAGGVKRAPERWKHCMDIFHDSMSFALDFLYLRKSKNKKLKTSLERFARENVDFAIKKIKSSSQLNKQVLQDVIERLEKVKIIAGYPEEILDPKRIEEIYAELNFNDELSYARITNDIYQHFERLSREPIDSQIGKLVQLRPNQGDRFKYSPYEDVLCTR